MKVRTDERGCRHVAIRGVGGPGGNSKRSFDYGDSRNGYMLMVGKSRSRADCRKNGRREKRPMTYALTPSGYMYHLK